MILPSPQYTTVDSVKVRLTNKVQFESPSGLLDGELPNALLFQLISDAETNIEMELRTRYAVPFRSSATLRYCDLSPHTISALRLPCDLKAVMLVLGTDFGRGTHVGADPYYKECEKQLKIQINLLLGLDAEGKMLKDTDSAARFRRSPPLPDLMLAPTNVAEADNGFRGKIINTDGSSHDVVDYAKRQINDPSKSYIKRDPGGI